MRKSNPIKLLLRALTLAAVSFALSVGPAFAHGGGTAGHQQPQAYAATAHPEHQPGHVPDAASCMGLVQADDSDLSATPCHGVPSGHVAGENCCTLACHAALTAPAVDSLGAFDLPESLIFGLTGMLEGRSSDRAERPPKLV
jgi:hypothetical protein